MFLAAVLNAYLQPAESAGTTPVIDLGANEEVSPLQGVALTKAYVRPARSEQAANLHADTRRTRAPW